MTEKQFVYVYSLPDCTLFGALDFDIFMGLTDVRFFRDPTDFLRDVLTQEPAQAFIFMKDKVVQGGWKRKHETLHDLMRRQGAKIYPEQYEEIRELMYREGVGDVMYNPEKKGFYISR